jgi:hypothetical protein
MSWILSQKVLSTTSAEPLSATTVICNQVLIQAIRGNNAAFMLGDHTVAAIRGIEIAVPPTTGQIPVLTLGGTGQNCVNLSEIYLIGEMGDGVNFFYEVF